MHSHSPISNHIQLYFSSCIIISLLVPFFLSLSPCSSLPQKHNQKQKEISYEVILNYNSQLFYVFFSFTTTVPAQWFFSIHCFCECIVLFLYCGLHLEEVNSPPPPPKKKCLTASTSTEFYLPGTLNSPENHLKSSLKTNICKLRRLLGLWKCLI